MNKNPLEAHAKETYELTRKVGVLHAATYLSEKFMMRVNPKQIKNIMKKISNSEIILPNYQVATLADRQKTYLAMEDGYQQGAIISDSWGYEQANIDYYRIEKRNGEWLTLILIGSSITEDGFMQGTILPLDQAQDPRKHPSFRKKLKYHQGKPTAFAAWSARLWNAKPERCSWGA